jgi:hypothetical protein
MWRHVGCIWPGQVRGRRALRPVLSIEIRLVYGTLYGMNQGSPRGPARPDRRTLGGERADGGIADRRGHRERGRQRFSVARTSLSRWQGRSVVCAFGIDATSTSEDLRAFVACGRKQDPPSGPAETARTRPARHALCSLRSPTLPPGPSPIGTSGMLAWVPPRRVMGRAFWSDPRIFDEYRSPVRARLHADVPGRAMSPAKAQIVGHGRATHRPDVSSARACVMRSHASSPAAW